MVYMRPAVLAAACGGMLGALLALLVAFVVLRTLVRDAIGAVGSTGRGLGVTGAGIVDTGARALDTAVERGGAGAGVVARDGVGATGAWLALV
jgi:hypothetical protein